MKQSAILEMIEKEMIVSCIARAQLGFSYYCLTFLTSSGMPISLNGARGEERTFKSLDSVGKLLVEMKLLRFEVWL